MWSSKPYTFDRVVRIFFTAVVACVVLYFMYSLRDVLLPFFVACLIAYIIEPLVELNRRWMKLKSHTWAVVITILMAVAVLVGVMCVIVPVMEDEISQLSLLLKRYVKNYNPEINIIPQEIHQFFHSKLDIDKLIAEVEKINVNNTIDHIWRSFTSGLEKILGMLGWLIVVVYVLFILLDFDKYKNGVLRYVPQKYMPVFSEVAHDVSWSMKRYFRNQFLISIIVGICYMIGFSIVGIPMAVVIGFINILLFMVPYLVYVSVIPVTLMCAFLSMETGHDFWTIWFECIAVYVFVEMFSDLVLTPRIMGKALGMNPGMILLSLSVWGSMLGLLGMVIALPATTILMKWGKLCLASWRNQVDSSS